MSYTTVDGEINFAKLVKHGIFIIIALLLLTSVCGVISAGERGVKTRLGRVVSSIEPGFYVKMPLIERVTTLDVRTRTINYDKNGAEGDSVDASQLFGASKDLQDVKIGVMVNYHVDPTKVVDIYTQYKNVDAYEQNVLEPVVREIVKSVSALYTAEELVTKRSEYSDAVNMKLLERFDDKGAVMERFSITNFEFSKTFSEAIEAKVTATQQAEAAKNKLEQVKFEAQQQIEKAKADAESIRIQAQAITQQGGKDYVQLKAIERWDGMLPTQMVPNGAVPFLELNK